jgi:hypothetical protein
MAKLKFDAEQLRQAAESHRRPDGSPDYSAIGRALGIVPFLAEYLLRDLESGNRAGVAVGRPSAIHDATTGVISRLSRPDGTFLIGAIGDLHAGSKYCRYDVRNDLIDWFNEEGVDFICDTGNWIDGEARFNRYDLEAHGMASQISMLAERHRKAKAPIFAVAGDDHEGWYTQQLGVDVGAEAERVMRRAGHDWTDLGYMEAHISLVNANSGMAANLAVVHPGGGSSYALSYAAQKTIESYEGGEKPAVVFFGHWHKLWSGLIRNVWVVQTGTSQDQTPFMRKKGLEAHVGGCLVRLKQEPRTGAIVQMGCEIRRYFNKAFYEGTVVNNRWSHSGPVQKPIKASLAC